MAGGQGIDIGGIYADLNITTGNLDRGLAKGRQALQAIDKELNQLDSDLDSGAVTLMAYTARVMALSRTQDELADYMRDAYTATKTLHTGLELVTRSGNSMVHATNRMGQGLMQLGYIADDIQYGFSGIVNNIAPLVYGLGGSGGLATAAQLAAVATYQLYTHWDQFQELIGTGAVKTEAEEMEALAKATKLTADEQERLNKYKQLGKEIKTQDSLESTEQKETRKAVNDVIAETGQGKIRSMLADQMNSGMTPDQKDQIAALKAQQAAQVKLGGKSDEGLDRKLEQTIKDINETNRKEAVERATKLLGQAALAGPEGDQARANIQSRFGDPNHPLHAFAMQLGETSPEARGRAKAAEFEAEQRKKEAREKEQQDKKDAQEAKQAAAAKERDREKELGRMGYLEERAGKGLNTPGETAELGRLKDADAKRKQAEKDRESDAQDSAHQRAVGRLQFLEEKADAFGVTQDEGTELVRLRQEDSEKQAREAHQEQQKSLRAGMDAAPGGTREAAQVMAMQAMGGAISPIQALTRISKELQRNGATQEESELAASKFWKDAVKDTQEGIVQRALKGEQGGGGRSSQLFDSNALAAQFQSSVGGSEDKKQTGYLEMLTKQLDALAKSGNLVKIK